MTKLKGVHTPFFLSVHSPRLRGEALLAQAAAAFERGDFADALVITEGICRELPSATAPAILRAKIVQACRPTLAPRAWDAAWSCDPENPALQDAMLDAWLQAGGVRQVADLAVTFLPQRCREGTHEKLLAFLRKTGLQKAGACWRAGDAIEGMCFDLRPASEQAGATMDLVIADETAEHPFSVAADGSRFSLAVPKPHGAWSVAFAEANGAILQGSPVVFPSSEPARKAAPADTGRAIDIIIPVYRDPAGAQACIRSVLSSLPQNKTPARVIVVDDASPEPALSAWLDGLAHTGWITLLRNRFNLGFIEASNRGLRHSATNDALLLNADTDVRGDWLDRLAASLASAPDIASVMPWSNNGEIGNLVGTHSSAAAPDRETLRQIDTTIAGARATGEISDAEIPTCSGFAMLMRRSTINQIGTLDGVGLVRGYLEEVDWCLRARAAGFRHLLATGVFVTHKGSSSFRMEKRLRVRQNRATLAARYPHYYAEYAQFMAEDPLAAARKTIFRALAKAGTRWPAPSKSAASSSTSIDFTESLRSSCARVGVWQHRVDSPSADKLLALARRISNLPKPGVRLLVMGEASEALRHTGVVDVASSATDKAFLSDSTLLRLAGCVGLLSDESQPVPGGIAHISIDKAFHSNAWTGSPGR